MVNPVAKGRRSSIDIVLTLAGIAGIAAMFLPVWGDQTLLFIVALVVSYAAHPQDSLLGWIFLAALLYSIHLALFLPILIFGASSRWISSGRFTRRERIGLYALSAAFGVPIAYFIVAGGISALVTYRHLPSALVALIYFAQLLVVIGLAAVIWDILRDRSGGFRPIMTTQLAYIGGAVVWLGLYLGGIRLQPEPLQIGAYLVGATVAVYLAQILWVMRGPSLRGKETAS